MKGHIRERSPGHWAIVIDLEDKAAGKRRRKWHSYKGTKRGAQEKCAQVVHELKSRTYVETTKETVAQFLERWLTNIKLTVSPKTFHRYQEICRRNIVPLLGAKVLAKLQPDDITTAYAKAQEIGTTARGPLSSRSVVHMHRVLKQALGPVRWERIHRTSEDHPVKPPKVNPANMKTYDMGQTAALLDALRGERIYIPVLLAVLCGMRRGEIAALRWKSVDITTGQIAVVQSAEQTKTVVRYKEPKSGRSRTVALPALALEELRAHRLRQAEELLRLGIRLSDETFVCAREDGLPMQPDSFTHDWDRKIATTDLPRIRFHDLRHTHATLLLASGVHPKIASERLGHSKVGITLDLYSHVLPNMQADAAALVDGALRAALNKPETKRN
jgi:integrase